MRQKRRAAAGKYGVNRIYCLIAYTLSFGGDSREIPYIRDGNNRIRYAAGRGRPALPTASPRIGHDVISSVGVAEVEKSHTIETETIGHEHQKILARAGSAPRNPRGRDGNKRTLITSNNRPRWLTVTLRGSRAAGQKHI